MAYTNAIYYLDYELGLDTARSDLVPSAYSDNGVGLVRVTVGTYDTAKYPTGSIVTIAGTTGSVYVGQWKITSIDNTHIDLQASTYTSNPATKGTCIPLGGGSWSDPWKTITGGVSGPIAANIAPGDIIRIAKSPAPVKLSGATGKATWTNKSKTVTLAEAQNTNISLCEADWTAVHATTAAKLAVATDAKEGSYCVKIVEDASPGASEQQAYFNTGDLVLSSYQKISFWLKNEVAITDGETWVIKLWDTAGGTGSVVDQFKIPAVPSTGQWVPLTLARVDGGNMGSSTVKSISIENGTTTPTASKYVYLDDIIACTTDGLNLQSLISKNTLEKSTVASTNYGNEAWHGIQSINGTTVLLDNHTNCKANQGKGYTGATELVDTYIRETIKTTMVASSSTNVQALQDSGTGASSIAYQGGYDAGTGNQTGETIYDGLNGFGYGLFANSSRLFNTMNNFGFVRYQYGMSWGAYGSKLDTITNVNNNTQHGIYMGGYGGTIGNIINANNNGYMGLLLINAVNVRGTYVSACNNLGDNNYGGIGITGGSCMNIIFDKVITKNNTGYGIKITNYSTIYIKNLISADNNGSCVFMGMGDVYIGTATISDGTKVYFPDTFTGVRCFINNISAYSNIWTEGGNVVSQNATAGGTGKEWKITISSTARVIDYPIPLSVAKIAVVANKQVTVSAYIKKSHATNIGAKLVCEKNQIAWSDGDTDIETVAPSDTNRNSVQLQFTPTEDGVVEIKVLTYYIANTGNVIVDDMTITQAD